MKTPKKWFKTIAIFLIGLILTQSCTVYRRTPVSLEQAAQQNLKAKVETTSNETFKFKYITYEEGQFYGVKKKSGDLVKEPLQEEDITKILLHNKSGSTWLTVAVLALPVAFVLFSIGMLIVYWVSPESF